MEQNTYITITRQYGSGGKEVAKIVAEKLGLRCYDRKVVSLAAAEAGVSQNFDDALERSYNSPENCLGNLGDYAYERVPEHNRMYIEQAKVILAIAKKGSAVFLGRCADYILKEEANTYSFFICADEEFRQNRSKDHYGNMTLKELDKEDKNRKRYYAYYTGRQWGDPQNYDVVINTSHVSLETAADMIIQYIDLRQAAAKK
jgi:cytidylate kinase